MELNKEFIEQYKNLVEYLLKELDSKNQLLKEYELRFSTINHYLTSEISSKRYGKIKLNENE